MKTKIKTFLKTALFIVLLILMLVVLNDTDKEQEIKIDLDLERLKVKPGLNGQDAFEPALKWELAPTWKAVLPPRGVRLIVFK